MEFEKENDVMDQRQEMMDDAIDDVTGVEDEEEGEEVVKEVLDEIGVDLGQAVCVLFVVHSSFLADRGSALKRRAIWTDEVFDRWERRLLGFKRPLLQTDELPKPLEDQQEEGVVELEMMICKLVWMAYDDETCFFAGMVSQHCANQFAANKSQLLVWSLSCDHFDAGNYNRKATRWTTL